MRPEPCLPDQWYKSATGVFLLAGQPGQERRRHLRNLLALAERETGARTCLLPCSFEDGGPWAGVKELFQSIVEELRTHRPDLIRKHDYELVMALPELRATLDVRNPTLTDMSPSGEKVRNYPADRAYRMVHGLIDLLASWHRERGGGPLVIACDDFDHCGRIGRRVFSELVRRRGEALDLILLAAVGPDALEEAQAAFRTEMLAGIEIGQWQPDPQQKHDPARAEQLARELQERVGGDTVAIQAHLPELLRLWREAGAPKRVLTWRCWGLEVYNTLGLYEDALVYGEGTLDEAKLCAPENHELHWSIFVKLYMSLLGLQRAEEAQRLAAEIEDTPMEPARRGQFFYLIAMLRARFSPERDLAKGEEYLERGLQEILRSGLPPDELHFQVVFNRNGLAMIRTFQRRFEEALELCREGHARLESYLGRERHRLHRSVLLYNMAQVYAALESYDEAIRHYSAAIEMDPNYSEYYNERGSAYLKLGRCSEARQDYLRAIELSPPYFEVYTNLGQCCRITGLHDEAVDAYSVSLDLQPAQAAALLGRAQSHEALGRSLEALADYDALLALEPDQWQALGSRAVLHYEAGRLHECQMDLDRAIRNSPGTPELYFNRALVRTDLGRSEDAVEDLVTCLRLDPDASDRPEIEARVRALQGSVPLSA